MFEVELVGKLPELRTHEDYLTSCIFGALKYLPPNHGLFPFLNSSFNYRLNTSLESYLKLQDIELTHFDKAQFHFWPRSWTYGEPDLVISLEGKLGSFLIPIEVKYFSRKHGEEEKDQLVRYYIALGTVEGRKTFNNEAIRQFSGGLLAFIYLTQFEAELELEQTLDVLESKGIGDAKNKFFHLRWQQISNIIEPILLKEHDANKKAIYTDIKELMIFKNLVPFTRFSKVPVGLTPELLLQLPVFFESEDIRRRHFTRFPDLPKQLSPGILSQLPVFLHLKSTKGSCSFSGFQEIPKSLELKYKQNIYYGGP